MLGPWRCTGDTNKELVENLAKSGIITKERVYRAMLATDRAFYAPAAPYADTPQPIGYHQTISGTPFTTSATQPYTSSSSTTPPLFPFAAPHMHAQAGEVIDDVVPPTNGKVLDVGSGSGYLAAVFARMCGDTGRVWGVEVVDSLVQLSKENVSKDDSKLLSSGRVQLLTRDGWNGLPEEAPFDAIHVGAAAREVPLKLVEQLRVGGRLFVPVGPEGGPQYLMQIDKTSDEGPVEKSFTSKELMGVIYVPLVETGR
ncbi:unnamed protein product [Chrysoparadoxa australica]